MAEHGNSIVPIDEESLDIHYQQHQIMPMLNSKQYEHMDRVLEDGILESVRMVLMYDRDLSTLRLITSSRQMMYLMLDIRPIKISLSYSRCR
jgi:hypothetical protein